MSTTIHFVYAVPDFRLSLWRRACRKFNIPLERRFAGTTPTWRDGGVKQWFAYAPSSITQHVYEYLRARIPVKLYDFRERIKPRIGKQDIILGHPWNDPLTIIQRWVMEATPCRAKILMFPYHHGIPNYNAYAAPLVAQSDLILGITGPYWYDTIDQSPFASWKPKMRRLDMAIDTAAYPFVKTSFNPPGKRKFLYIGSDLDCKGLDVLSRTMAQLPNFECAWFGPGMDVPHIHHRAKWAVFTPAFAQEIAREYDFYIHTGISDANPTTILEAMAWGLPVACTPQSGYYNQPTIVSLSITDIDRNVEQLSALQFAPEASLVATSQFNRRLVETNYTWDRFCSSVWQALQPYLSS